MHPTFYKILLDNLYDGVYFTDRDRVITYWNRGGGADQRISGRRSSRNILQGRDPDARGRNRKESPDS